MRAAESTVRVKTAAVGADDAAEIRKLAGHAGNAVQFLSDLR